MRACVGNTDHDWYSFLLARQTAARALGRPGLDEVNFWKPSGRPFRMLAPGEPFFFRLKSPYNMVAGFGVFARYEVLPDWLAWEAFGEANGNPSLSSLRKATRSYLHRKGGADGEHADAIGCVMLTQPVFFDESDWIEGPLDWQPNIVSYKGYDLEAAEGKRLLRECLDRVASPSGFGGVREVPAYGEQRELPGLVDRYGRPTLVRPRLGQGTFRIAVTEAYDRACAVTGEHSLPVLEAAHIKPYADGGEHAVSNGLLLRTDLHRLFDNGYVTVDEDHRLVVSRRLRDEFHNGKTYYQMAGQNLLLPARFVDRPDESLLAWHREHVFAA
jgi:putative restriction endonuclease